MITFELFSLEASLWCVDETASYREAVLLAANLGNDADTTAAIAGQLAGALYGVKAIPQKWRAKPVWHNEIADRALALLRDTGPHATDS